MRLDQGQQVPKHWNKLKINVPCFQNTWFATMLLNTKHSISILKDKRHMQRGSRQ